MQSVANNLDDCRAICRKIDQCTRSLDSLNGARNPHASLREVKEVIACLDDLGIRMESLRKRYVGAALVSTAKAGA